MQDPRYSDWGARLLQGSGIQSLMEDLGSATGSESEALLGGGNPAHIPMAEELLEEVFRTALAKTPLSQILGDYQAPIGNDFAREALADYLGGCFGTRLTKKNIAFFPGSQSAFAFLCNFFAKKIFIPIVPEYIGYADLNGKPNQFYLRKPLVKKTTKHRFYYEMSREEIPWQELGAVLFSRPTNPTGNVLPIDDLNWIETQTQAFQIPILFDLAYGYPFPNLQEEESPLLYKPGRIFALSLSKLGLPGLRIGILVAEEEIIQAANVYAAINHLAIGNIGLYVLLELIQKNQMITLTNNILRPFYEKQKLLALQIFEEEFQIANIPYEIHEPKGGFFLWIRFMALRISNQRLYELCKEEGLYFVSGHHFFMGMLDDFSHKWECIRLTYSRKEEELARGAKILTKIVSNHLAKKI